MCNICPSNDYHSIIQNGAISIDTFVSLFHNCMITVFSMNLSDKIQTHIITDPFSQCSNIDKSIQNSFDSSKAKFQSSLSLKFRVNILSEPAENDKFHLTKAKSLEQINSSVEVSEDTLSDYPMSPHVISTSDISLGRSSQNTSKLTFDGITMNDTLFGCSSQNTSKINLSGNYLYKTSPLFSNSISDRKGIDWLKCIRYTNLLSQFDYGTTQGCIQTKAVCYQGAGSVINASFSTIAGIINHNVGTCNRQIKIKDKISLSEKMAFNCSGGKCSGNMFNQNWTLNKINKPRQFDTDGYRMRAACVCVRNSDENEVLLVTSSSDKKRWVIPGGGIEANETGMSAAIRETTEEAGVTGLIDRLLGTFENDESSHRTMVYVLIVDNELSDWQEKGRDRKWFPLEEAREIISKNKPAQLCYLNALMMKTKEYENWPHYNHI